MQVIEPASLLDQPRPIPGGAAAVPRDMPASDAVETLLRRAVLVVAIGLSALLGYFTAYALLLLMAGVLAFLALRHRAALARFDLTARLFLGAFLLLVLAAAGTARDTADLLAPFNFAALLLYAPLAALFGRAATPRNIGKIAGFALVGSALAVLTALGYIALGPSPRAAEGAMLTDPVRLAATALIIGLLAVVGAVATGGKQRWLYLFGPVLALVVVFACGSRAALLAFPLLALVAAFLLANGKRPALLLGTLILVAFGVVAWAADLLGTRSSTLFDIIGQLVADGDTADPATMFRFILYRAGWAAFLEAPLLGHGWGSVMYAIVPHLSPSELVVAVLPHLHNDGLQFAVAAGLPGLCAYLLLLATPILAGLAAPRDGQYRPRLYGSVLLSVSYLVLGLPDTMLAFGLHLTLYVVLTAVLAGYCRDRPT